MAQSNAAAREPKAEVASPTPYAALAAAPGGLERTDLLLAMIEAAAPGPLELPSEGEQGAMLDEIDLSPAALEARLPPAPANPEDGAGGEYAPPVWWDEENGRAALPGANLTGASLRQADLERADLTGSRLHAAALGGARLRGAVLEEADLSGADLAGADLSGAQLGGANLEGALLEEALLPEAGLRFVRLQESFLESADLQKADLWSARLTGAHLAGADLSGGTLNEADLAGADLTGANLQGADLNGTNLEAARLTRADLRHADLTGASLRGAHLERARLEDLDLTRCNLTHVFLEGAALQRARFSREQLGGAIGEEVAGSFEEARQGYLALERHFVELGDPDVARWAYRKRRRMQKRAAYRQARAAWSDGQRRAAIAHGAVYAGDQLVEWICDYGESIGRVLLSMLAVYVAFTILYGLTSSVVRVAPGPPGIARAATHRPLDLAVFSLFAMTTQGSPVGMQARSEAVQFLTGIEALLGIGLTGLLGFVIGNRIRH